jgi:hypothetical protein
MSLDRKEGSRIRASGPIVQFKDELGAKMGILAASCTISVTVRIGVEERRGFLFLLKEKGSRMGSLIWALRTAPFPSTAFDRGDDCR